jgi:hypothetical protein
MMPTMCHPQNPRYPPPYHGNGHSQTWPHPATSTATSTCANIRQQASMQQLNQPLRPAMTATQPGLSRAVTRSRATLDRGASDLHATCLQINLPVALLHQQQQDPATSALRVLQPQASLLEQSSKQTHPTQNANKDHRQPQCSLHCMPTTSHDATWVTRCVEQATRIPEPSPTSTWL